MGDLVVATIPGVGRFLSESRTTGDVFASSHILSELAAAMMDEAGRHGKVVLPYRPYDDGPDGSEGRGGHGAGRVRDVAGLPNRITVRTAAGEGEALGAGLAERVRRHWRDRLVRLSFEETKGYVPEPDSGFPRVQWVAVPEDVGDYRQQWELAQRALEARGRTRNFPGYDSAASRVCALSGRWAAAPAGAVGASRRLSSTPRRGEALSVTALVKRSYRELRAKRADSSRWVGFPSSASVATASFRAEVAAQLADHDELRAAAERLGAVVAELGGIPGISVGSSDVPGLADLAGGPDPVGWLAGTDGIWCFPETWDAASLRRDFDLPAGRLREDLCARGRGAVQRLIDEAGRLGIAAPSRHLALVVQDADRMGERLGDYGGADPSDWHGRMSKLLANLSVEQTTLVEHGARDPDTRPGARHDTRLLGRAVYAGGDDFLGLVPVRDALPAARLLNEEFTTRAGALYGPGDGRIRPTASTAVVFFHVGAQLQTAVESARSFLTEVKQRHRPGFGAVLLRRGGERTRLVLPWTTVRRGDVGECRTTTPSVELLETLTARVGAGLSGGLAATLERDEAELHRLAESHRRWAGLEIRRLLGRQTDSAEVGTALLDLAGGSSGAWTQAALVARFVAGETKVKTEEER